MTPSPCRPIRKIMPHRQYYHSVSGRSGSGDENARVVDDLGNVICTARDRDTADLITLLLNEYTHQKQQSGECSQTWAEIDSDIAISQQLHRDPAPRIDAARFRADIDAMADQSIAEVSELELRTLAAEILGSELAVSLWLGSPQPGLDGRLPSDLIQTPEGQRLVLDLLVRIQHGVYT